MRRHRRTGEKVFLKLEGGRVLSFRGRDEQRNSFSVKNANPNYERCSKRESLVPFKAGG